MLMWQGSVNYLGIPYPRPVYYGGRKLTPLEKQAANAISQDWARTGSHWVDVMLWTCKDLQIDAIINYNVFGCSATLPLKQVVQERAEKELGIPTLQLEGKCYDPSYADEATITAKLNEFIDMCISKKGLQ